MNIVDSHLDSIQFSFSIPLQFAQIDFAGAEKLAFRLNLIQYLL